MFGEGRNSAVAWKGRVLRVLILKLALSLGACAGLPNPVPDLVAAKPEGTADAAPVKSASVPPPQDDLQKATEYWGKEYAKSPQNAEAALAYARNLKAMGRKSEAFTVLQQAAQVNAANKPLLSEYGRLALDFEQTTLAAQVLEHADDPTKPDWRTISARGAALAKLGRYKDAVQHLERAYGLAPGQASVQNNLALAYAMSGEAPRAEELLRTAVATDGANPKTRQNLALVLGLQGKYAEATTVGASAVAADVAEENTDIVRRMVRLEPKSEPAPQNGPVAVPKTAVPKASAQPAPSRPVAMAAKSPASPAPLLRASVGMETPVKSASSASWNTAIQTGTTD